MTAIDAAADTLRRWIADPVVFVQENFDVTPDPWQGEALRAFADPSIPRISLQACVGPGKSTVMAWCAWWFLTTQGEVGNHPKGVATSVTGDNLSDGLWAELSKWRDRSPFLQAVFEWTKTRVFSREHPATWFIAARSWPKTASPEQQGDALAGLHSKFIAVFIDESGTIPPAVGRKADQILSSCAFGCIIQAGNPSSLEGLLYQAAGPRRAQWHVIRITGDPDDPHAWVHAPRVREEERQWAREQIASYGRENPWVMSSILGQFPPTSVNALLGVEDVEQAMARHIPRDQFEWAQKRIGIDVARFGDDRTVMFPRQGLAAFKPIVMRHARNSSVSVDIANRVLTSKLKWGSEQEFFDATGGWAAGAIDILRSMGHGPMDVQFSSPAIDPRYENRRAEIWFGMSEWIKRGGALPKLPEMVAELVTPTYLFSKSGKMLIEPKDMVKKRIGRSPDLADALALTFGLPEMPGRMGLDAVAGGTRRDARASTEFDPYTTPEREQPVRRSTRGDVYAPEI